MNQVANTVMLPVSEYEELKAQRGTFMGEGTTNGAFNYSPLGQMVVDMEKRALRAEALLREALEQLPARGNLRRRIVQLLSL